MTVTCGCVVLFTLAGCISSLRAQEVPPPIRLEILLQEAADPEERLIGLLTLTARQPGFAPQVYARFMDAAHRALASGADERTERAARFLLCGSSDCTPLPVASAGGAGLVASAAPAVRSKVRPRIPEVARRARVEGTVQLQVDIDTAGRVAAVRAVQALPLGATEAAAAAVRQWRFAAAGAGEPALRTAVIALPMGQPRFGRIDPSDFSWVNTSTIRLVLVAFVLGLGFVIFAIRLLFLPFQRRRDRVAASIAGTLRNGGGRVVPRYRLFLRPFVLYSRHGPGLLGGLYRRVTGTRRDRYGLARAGWLQAAFERMAGSMEDYFEETIARATQDEEAPLVALGRSRNLGAGKITVGTREWRNLALLLMRHAETIYLIPSDHPGTLWEIEQILDLDLLRRTVWIMPPALGPGFENEWNAMAERLRGLGLDLPAHQGCNNLNFFTLVWAPLAPRRAPAELVVAAPGRAGPP